MKYLVVLLAAAWVCAQEPPSTECTNKEAISKCLENVDPELCGEDINCLCAVYQEANKCFSSCPEDVEAKTYAETAQGFCNWEADDAPDDGES